MDQHDRDHREVLVLHLVVEQRGRDVVDPDLFAFIDVVFLLGESDRRAQFEQVVGQAGRLQGCGSGLQVGHPSQLSVSMNLGQQFVHVGHRVDVLEDVLGSPCVADQQDWCRYDSRNLDDRGQDLVLDHQVVLGSLFVMREAVQGGRNEAEVHEGHEVGQLALTPLAKEVLVELEGLQLGVRERLLELVQNGGLEC